MELPKFVKLDHSALRLVGNKYYRDGGNWSVGYVFIENELFSWIKGTPRLHKKPLIQITKEEWKKDNGQYTPNI